MPKSTQFIAALITLATLPGCFLFLDDYDDDDDVVIVVEEPNSAPEIIEADTWWLCDFDTAEDTYFFEFQASVDDLDGLGDVRFVDVTVEDAITNEQLDAFGLVYEGGGVWGGLIWEDESNLFCGEEINVIVEAWDTDEAYDRLLIRY